MQHRRTNFPNSQRTTKSPSPSGVLKLFVAIPSGDTWNRLFGMSMIMMVAELCSISNLVSYKAVEFRPHNHRGSILSRSREKLANQALSYGASHMLFLDSDMAFPPNLVSRLVAHQKLVVAANCPTKMIPASTTARSKGKTWSGEQVYSDEDKHGLEEVWRVGTGVMLINMEVFKRLKKPWFPIVYLPEVDDYQGEDWSFCEKLEQAGIPIFIDHDVSRQIGHCGDFTYSHDVVGSIVQEPIIQMI